MTTASTSVDTAKQKGNTTRELTCSKFPEIPAQYFSRIHRHNPGTYPEKRKKLPWQHQLDNFRYIDQFLPLVAKSNNAFIRWPRNDLPLWLHVDPCLTLRKSKYSLRATITKVFLGLRCCREQKLCENNLSWTTEVSLCFAPSFINQLIQSFFHLIFQFENSKIHRKKS